MAKGIARWFSHIVFQAKIQTYHARRGIAAANNPLNPDNKAGMSDSVPTAKLNDLADRLNRCGFVVADAEHSSDVRKNYLDLALQLDTIAAANPLVSDTAQFGGSVLQARRSRAKMNPETVEGILSVVVIDPQRARCS